MLNNKTQNCCNCNIVFTPEYWTFYGLFLEKFITLLMEIEDCCRCCLFLFLFFFGIIIFLLELNKYKFEIFFVKFFLKKIFTSTSVWIWISNIFSRKRNNSGWLCWVFGSCLEVKWELYCSFSCCYNDNDEVNDKTRVGTLLWIYKVRSFFLTD